MAQILRIEFGKRYCWGNFVALNHNNGKLISQFVAETTAITTGRKNAKDGVIPNFAHACDAAHLLLTVNAALAEGIT
jgi:DNA-directed RNA polymerase